MRAIFSFKKMKHFMLLMEVLELRYTTPDKDYLTIMHYGGTEC